MKIKLLLGALTSVSLPVMAVCNWDTATHIYSNWRPYSTIKICALYHTKEVTYSSDDLLDGLANGGKSIPFGDSPQKTMDIGSTNVSVSGNGNDVPALPLKAPPYYLTGKGNTTGDSGAGTAGIFRFYTKTLTYPCLNDSLGYSHIRKHIFENFLKDVSINSKHPQASSNKTIAKIEDVTLQKSDSSIKANVFFIEGQKIQKGTNSSFSQKICSLDVYLKLQLKPDNSPNFKSSGKHELNITHPNIATEL